MMKKISIIILFLFSMWTINAQTGLKTIEHIVEKGQTLYFISKKYDMSVQDIMRFNPQIGKDMILKEGMILKIYTKPTPVLNVANHKYHIVEKGETLYSLSKIYNISVDDLIYLNQLQTPNIAIGDKIIVQNVDKEAVYQAPKTVEKVNTEVKKEPIKPAQSVKPAQPAKPEVTYTIEETSAEVEMYKALYDGYENAGATLNKAKGIGNFLEQSASKDVYLALVNGVESGQVIRVRNLMNNRVIYLKVIGNVPSKDETNNISIKISKAAARDLKIMEDRFLAEWTWYKKELPKTATDPKSKTSVKVSDF